MTKTKIPVGLPYPNPTLPYWQIPKLPIADHRTTKDLPESSQYVIVGSGITGASIAYKLLCEEPSASILMLEARQAASGATGRNGGHCRGGDYLKFKDDLDNYGVDEAIKHELLEENNVRNVSEFIREHGLDCDLRDVETVDIFCNPEKWQRALATMKARKEAVSGHAKAEMMTKHKMWTQEQAREELLVPEAFGAISFAAHALQPYKLACGVLGMALEKGLNLQTNTPVVEVSQSRGERNPWVVHTERGDVYAEKVILATNAYTPALYPPLANFIIPTRAQAVAIRPGLAIAGNPVLRRTICMNNLDGSGEYMQSRVKPFTGDGDIIIGGGRIYGTNEEQPQLDDTTIHPRISKYLTQACSQYFGKENWGENGRTVKEWTGIMGYTQDRQPVVGEAPGQKGLWICAGFNGHGMGLAFQTSEALVQLLMGREDKVDEWLPKNYKLSRVTDGNFKPVRVKRTPYDRA